MNTPITAPQAPVTISGSDQLSSKDKKDTVVIKSYTPLPSPTFLYPNDRFTIDELPNDVLEALDFWARETPNEPALRVPRGDTVEEGYEAISFLEWKQLRDRYAPILAQRLRLPAVANLPATTAGQRTVGFLVSPVHEVILPWIALASMGYTCQFISPVHQHDVVAKLLRQSDAHLVLHLSMESVWLRNVQQEIHRIRQGGDAKRVAFVEIAQEDVMLRQLDALRKGAGHSVATTLLHQVKPQPFVVLHSFGSTSSPKLYNVPITAANSSARDSALYAHLYPFEQRWRCQLQTSLPFHFSFQNPVWRALKCGTTLAFPMIKAIASQGRASRLVPSADDILNSLWLSKADLLYCSPSGLQGFLERSISPSAPAQWREAVRNLRQAHTGAAPVSEDKAECYERHGLNVFQVFALTETGLMFYGRKDLTGDLRWLKPLLHRKQHMLWRRQSGSDIYELWLKDSFPGLLGQAVHFEAYPEDPSIRAWNTMDTFRKLPATEQHDDLIVFAGRQDDWIRCTHGAAARALELEDRLLHHLREAVGFDSIRAVTVIGSGRAAIGVVIELPFSDSNTPLDHAKLESAIESVRTWINKNVLQFPATLKREHFIFTTPQEPIFMTQKGSIQRKLNEAFFGPKLDAIVAGNSVVA